MAHPVYYQMYKNNTFMS